MVGVLPNHRSFQITHRSHNRQRCKHQFHDPKLQPHRAKIPHMESVMGKWHPTKSKKHPKLAVEGALCQVAYDEIGLKLPNTR